MQHTISSLPQVVAPELDLPWPWCDMVKEGELYTIEQMHQAIRQLLHPASSLLAALSDALTLRGDNDASLAGVEYGIETAATHIDAALVLLASLLARETDPPPHAPPLPPIAAA